MKIQIFKILFVCILLIIISRTAAEAQIIYTDIPDTTITINNTVFNIDLNNDSIADYYFYRTASIVTGSGTHCSGTRPKFVAGLNTLNGNKVLCSIQNQPTPISYESYIDSNSQSWQDTMQNIIGSTYICVYNTSTSSWVWQYTTSSWGLGFGLMPDSSTYIGLKFFIGSQIHYGWVRLYTSANAASFTIQDYAYNTIPNEPIIAGVGLDYCFDIEWTKCYGSRLTDFTTYIDKTLDGGFIVCGYINGDSGDVTGFHGGIDSWVIKLDSSGNLMWQNCLGGSNDDRSFCIHQTNDRGFIIAGSSTSNDFDVSGHHGLNTSADGWVVKLDSIGNLVWQKSLGGSSLDIFNSIEEIPGGDFITAGFTNSDDGDVTGLHDTTTTTDAWIVRLDSAGNIRWEKCFGGSQSDNINSIKLSPHGEFFGAGYTNSNDFDVSGNNGSNDCWVIKLDSAGNLLWQGCYGGSGAEAANSLALTGNGGFVFAGYTSSSDSDVTGYKGGGNDYWVVKADSLGGIQFQKCLGGSDLEIAHSLIQTSDGGFAVNGTTRSHDSDVVNIHIQGSYYRDDCWIVKLDSLGNIQWKRALGGTTDESGIGLIQTSDGNYVMTGWAVSVNGNVIPHNQRSGTSDYWIVKFHPQNSSSFQSPVICQGTSLVVGNNTYDSTGTYTDTLSAVIGCDSIIVTNLSVIICTDTKNLESNSYDLKIIPNPFSNSTTISFTISRPENTSIKIYDVTGRFIKTIANQLFNSGENKFNWSGDDENGKMVQPGIYFIRIDDGKYFLMKKIIVLQ